MATMKRRVHQDAQSGLGDHRESAAVESERTLAGLLRFYDPSGSNHGWKAQFLGGTASAFGGHVAPVGPRSENPR